MNKIKQYITAVLIQAYTAVNIVGLSPVFVNSSKPSGYVLYAASSGSGGVVVRVGGDKVAPERITSLIAKPRLVSGVYPSEEKGGRVELTWIAPKDPEVFNVHPDTYVFSYVIKYDTSLRGYNLNYLDQLWSWWKDAEKIFENHIWELPLQAKGQTLPFYPMGFGIASPEEKYKLTFGITDKIILTGLPKGEKIWVGVSSRDRYCNQSTPTVVETYVPAGIEPPSTVTDLAVSYAGFGTLKLNWTSPANDRFSIDASSGLYNIPDGRYCIAYSTTLPETLDLEPGPLIYTKWPGVNLIYIDTSTPKEVAQIYLVSGLTLIEATTAIGYYFLLWTSDEWKDKTNWSKKSNLAGYGLVAPDYVRDIVVISSASVDTQKGSFAILSWRNPKDEDIPLEGIKIYYSTNTYTTSESYFIKYTTIPASLVSTEHYQLLPRHWYYYVLLSFNQAGSRPWTSNVIAKTYTQYDFIAPDAVSSLSGLSDANEIDGSYISLSWINPDENLYQNKDLYIDGRIEVVYSSLSFTDPASRMKVLPPTSNTVKLTGLQPYTTYYISVITADGGSNKSTSTVSIYVPYDPYAPGWVKLLGYEVLASTDENIGSYVRFNLRNPSDRDLKEVRIYYSSYGWTKDNYVLSNNNVPLNEYFVDITQLYPMTTYYFIFVSYDHTNRYSLDVKQEIFIDKDILAPEPPSNIKLIADAKQESQPYGSYIKVSFDKPDTTKYKNWDLAGYEIYASTKTLPYEDPGAIHIVITDINKLTDEILNLNQHTTYYITICSFDGALNKSTSGVFSVFTWKDLIAPTPPAISISSYIVSEVPQEGLTVKLLNRFSDEIDLEKVVLELYKDDLFADMISSFTTRIYPQQYLEHVFLKLDVETTYYFKASVYDWSGNVAFSTLSYLVKLLPDNTVPLYPVGLKAEINGDFISLSWKKVIHHYNLLNGNKIEKFKGVNGLGPYFPTTYELYKYKVLYKHNLLDENENWKEIASFTPEVSSCSVALKKGYYKVLSYDISGNCDESLIVDNNLNYYIYKNGVYVKFTSSNGLNIAEKFLYYGVLEDIKQTKGNLLKVFNASLGELNHKEDEIIYYDNYKFDEENIVGVRYKVIDGKVKISDFYLEIDSSKIEKYFLFYVFDGKEYVKATTHVDKENQIIYFKTKFLSKTQLRKVNVNVEFNFVEAKPKIITPDSSLGENDVVFFVFNNPNGSKVKITIYDANLIPVWEKETTQDSSTPGSYFSWNGKDLSDRYVKPGVYIYQIEAEGKVFKGSVVVAR